MRGTWTDMGDKGWKRGVVEGGRVYPAKLPGHRLTLTWSGERGIESSSTAECICGWQESASSKRECRWEYRNHLADVYATSLDSGSEGV